MTTPQNTFPSHCILTIFLPSLLFQSCALIFLHHFRIRYAFHIIGEPDDGDQDVPKTGSLFDSLNLVHLKVDLTSNIPSKAISGFRLNINSQLMLRLNGLQAFNCIQKLRISLEKMWPR